MILNKNQNIKISKKQINQKLSLSSYQNDILKEIENIVIVSIINDSILLTKKNDIFSQIVGIEIVTKNSILKNMYKTIYKIIDDLFENTLLIIFLKNEEVALCTDLYNKINKFRTFKYNTGEIIEILDKVDNLKQYYEQIFIRLIEQENQNKVVYSRNILENDEILKEKIKVEEEIVKLTKLIKSETNMQKKIELKDRKIKLQKKISDHNEEKGDWNGKSKYWV
ncbi:MAG: hypothetical protein ACK5HR_03365 [Mycoplasmatales bacterium]